jgi:hypothetical protein
MIIIKVFVFFAFLQSSLIFAQWQPDLRLTNNPGTSYTSWPNARAIAAFEESIHCVWHDNRDGNNEIYYKHSTNNGLSWENDVRISNNPGVSNNASIAANGSNIHVVWGDNRDGNYEIYYKRSTDGGFVWGSETRLTNSAGTSDYSSMASNGTELHIVWQDSRDGNSEIYYKYSSDNGTSWGTDVRLTIAAGSSQTPSIAISGTTIHVAWMESRDANLEIYYKQSTDGGVIWGSDTRLTNAPGTSYWPSIAVFGSAVHVSWDDNRDGNNEIYYKRSSNGGANWGEDINLSNAAGTSLKTNISVSNLLVHVVWEENRDGNYEIYYKHSSDGGLIWDADLRLTNATGRSGAPFIALSASNVHVMWEDNRDGNYEMYFKKNPTGNLVPINNIQSGIPIDFNLNQNYPNPFNPLTIISFQVPESDFITMKIFNILGNEVTTLINENVKAGSYEVKWDASNQPSGVYFYTLQTSEFIQTKKMILLK